MLYDSFAMNAGFRDVYVSFSANFVVISLGMICKSISRSVVSIVKNNPAISPLPLNRASPGKLLIEHAIGGVAGYHEIGSLDELSPSSRWQMDI